MLNPVNIYNESSKAERMIFGCKYRLSKADKQAKVDSDNENSLRSREEETLRESCVCTTHAIYYMRILWAQTQQNQTVKAWKQILHSFCLWFLADMRGTWCDLLLLWLILLKVWCVEHAWMLFRLMHSIPFSSTFLIIKGFPHIELSLIQCFFLCAILCKL